MLKSRCNLNNNPLAWLRASAFPHVRDHGLDLHQGGYAERFDWRGMPVDPGFKRVRVMARQLYVFSHAAIGGAQGAGDAARHGMNFVARAIGEDGLVASRLTPDGVVLDPVTDLYDVAFVLFALAWWHRLSGEEHAMDLAEAVVGRLEGILASPSGRGFVARNDGKQEHQQNPHMHLFEAAIFLSAFSGRPAFRELADHLFQVAVNCLYDADGGYIAEIYDRDWRAGDQQRVIRIEPGHLYEWTWLLNRYGMLAGDGRAFAMADRLFAYAAAHGHNAATGLIYDAVRPDGSMLAADFRIWPNTEHLKALVSMAERYPDLASSFDECINEALDRIFRHFLTPRSCGEPADMPQGLWIDYLDGDSLVPRCDHIPASTLYHIMFAFTEVLRHRNGHDAFSGLPW